MHPTPQIVHRNSPPCHCPACLRATAQADQRRAEIDAILRRLDDAERMVAAEVTTAEVAK